MSTCGRMTRDLLFTLFGRKTRLRRREELSIRAPARIGIQRLPIGQHHGNDAPKRQAILDGEHSDGHFVANFERAFTPAGVRHGHRILRLSNPMDHLPVIVFYIELQQAMRIGPEPFRDRPFQSNFLLCFEGRGAVVRQ